MGFSRAAAHMKVVSNNYLQSFRIEHMCLEYVDPLVTCQYAHGNVCKTIFI